MPYKPKRGWIEQTAVNLGLIPNTDAPPETESPKELRTGQVPMSSGVRAALQTSSTSETAALPLQRYPAPDQWNDFVEYDPKEWPRRAKPRHYSLVPTVCFNCESACGLLAYVDKQTHAIRKLEGNPLHPGSRGRNCAKGPATINQVNDPDRILTPLKRVGPRGSGKWEPVAWDTVLEDVGGRIRKALQENRHNEIAYHVGRPGSEGFMDRVLRAWGIDGHNSHTNICSSGARFGYALWSGYDRPSPDYANARFTLALNAHLESGHYFNPHAQRISEGLARGGKFAVVDPRLSNTASMAHYWLPTVPGTEAALLLGFARVILEENLVDRRFVQRWTNWRDSLRALDPDAPQTLDVFLDVLKRTYAEFTPEFVETECGIPAGDVVEVGRLIGEAGSRFCSHTWRGAASAHLGGWQVSRCLFFLHVLTGSVGTKGGCSPSGWHKYKANLINPPPPNDKWNELHFPKEFPLAHYEMSFLLPHFLKEGRAKLDVYFTRVFNPVWTYPDGFTWAEVLADESKIGCHIALTPTWNETAFYADYVLPMGHGPERHDLTTYETHSGTWIAFRQPVIREALRREGKTSADSRDANPGQVWEEDEFWIALTWAIDPDGSLGARKYFESPIQPGEKLTVAEYYTHIFSRVPGLPEAAAAKNLSPLEYMGRFGAFEVARGVYEKHERRLSADERSGTAVDDATGLIHKNGAPIGVLRDGDAVEGFHTQSRLLEFYSSTMVEWGWPEHALPGYIRSHIDMPAMNLDDGEYCLLPTFRLPTLIHTRSGAAKWLNEISQRNPVWIHTADAARIGVHTGDLVRVETRIGHFVDRVWVTEAIRPGVVACSHHLGRWRRKQDPPNSRWSGSVVAIEQPAAGQWTLRTERGPEPFESKDPDSSRIWWRDGGVPQNLTFPVHPDPISGMHCWHQPVRVEKAHAHDRSGDVFVDTNRSMDIYREWLEKTRAEPRPDGLRRPLWLNRPLRPTDDAFRL